MEKTCRKYPRNEYIIFNNRRITYGDFYKEVNRLAKGLIELGLKKDDVIAIWMPNCPEWIIAQFAIYRIGAILLPIYTYYKEIEIEYSLKQSGVKAIIMKDEFIGKINSLEIFKNICPEINSQGKQNIKFSKFPKLKNVIALSDEEIKGRYEYAEVMELGSHSKQTLNKVDDFLQYDDIMNIMYTSGTTGFPKGGISIHQTNLTTVYHWTNIAGITDKTVILGQVPLFTNFGGLYVGPLAMLKGAKVILMESFNPEKSLELIEKENVDYIPGSPSMFTMIMEHHNFTKYNIDSLRTGHVAGAPLSEDLMEMIINKMGIENIMQAYGLSECGGVSTVTSANDPYEKRLNTVGCPLPSVKLKVVDEYTGESVTGKAGEIWLGDAYPNSCVGKGYWEMPNKTKEAITEDGWFKTGDLGILDHDGYLKFIGRKKDMITVGGFNIYPMEIEVFLEKHSEIVEAYVVGVPNHRLGEVPMAWVKTKESSTINEDDIIDYVKRNLSSQKVPRYVRFFKNGELPMTGSGKVKKYKLQKIATKELKLKK